MEIVQELVTAFVVIAMGGLITLVTRGQIRDLKKDVQDFKDDVKGEFREVRQDIRGLRSEMNERFPEQGGEIASLRSEMNERFREQGTEIAAVRSDLTQLALALVPRPRPETA